jgi:hypothetical protein
MSNAILQIVDARSPVRYNDYFPEKWLRYLSPEEWRGRVSLTFFETPLSALEHAGCDTDPDVVEGWLQTLRAGCPVPPPIATVTERGRLYLHDGNHRLEALRQYFGDEDALVRVAIVHPEPGYSFRRRQISDYETYVLEPVPSLWAAVRVFALALLSSLLAVGLTAATSAGSSGPYFVFFVTSVLVCARYLGLVAGLVASLVNVMAAAYLILPPVRSFLIEDKGHLVELAITGVVMLAISVGFGKYRQGFPFLRTKSH